MIVFSRENIKYTSRRLFTRRTLCIVVSSIIIGNVVRYYAIKYGIDTPLLSHPILFSSAVGISSFLSILSRITIEDIFNLFEYKQLALPVGELPVSKNSLTIDTNMKMVRGTGSGTGSPKYRNFGVSSPADEEKIRKLILEVKPSRNVRNTGMTNELINLLYDKKN